jgi:SAM-dependent methyltransferase
MEPVTSIEAPISTSVGDACPACGSHTTEPFYEVHRVPAHSCVLVSSKEEALRFPVGDLRLTFCRSCGFIHNDKFDASLLDYSQDYEETQGFSPRFQAFARDLAARLIDRFDLHGKHILEIGCGKGEFLVLLCEMGPNRGTGIDPAYVPERLDSEAADRITFIRDYYTEAHRHLEGDLVCCRHTLEHIPDVAVFLRRIRDAIGGRATPVFLEVPDTRRVLRETAFWDIYHEHCSYFTLGSLARLFRACGFEVLDLATDFDDQYLLIDARPGDPDPQQPPHPAEEGVDQLAEEVESFRRDHRVSIDGWRDRLRTWRGEGRRTVVWGSGSKGVAFLTTLGITDEVERVVDVNPFRDGKFMIGTGHEIVSPESLRAAPPDVVVVMNPIYMAEISEQMRGMGLAAEFVAV